MSRYLPRLRVACAVPGCQETGHFGRGGAALALCYWHGRLFADSPARQAVAVVALKWAKSQQPINRAAATSAQVEEEDECSKGRS